MAVAIELIQDSGVLFNRFWSLLSRVLITPGQGNIMFGKVVNIDYMYACLNMSLCMNDPSRREVILCDYPRIRACRSNQVQIYVFIVANRRCSLGYDSCMSPVAALDN